MPFPAREQGTGKSCAQIAYQALRKGSASRLRGHGGRKPQVVRQPWTRQRACGDAAMPVRKGAGRAWRTSLRLLIVDLDQPTTAGG